MHTVVDLLQAIDDLTPHAEEVFEESFRLIVEGKPLCVNVREKLLHIFTLSKSLNIPLPMLRAADTNETIDLADLVAGVFDGRTWRLVLGKTPVAGHMSARNEETTLVFFSVNGFHQWLNKWDPFLRPTGNIPDLEKPTTIRVHGLSQSVGGPQLWVLPPDHPPPNAEPLNLPDSEDVHSLIHTNTTKALRVCPKGYALTWGDLEGSEVAPLIRMSAIVMSACLVQELHCIDECYETILKGTKRLSLKMYHTCQFIKPETLQCLMKTIVWVYDERPETRLGLIMDRLSIDIENGQTLLSGMEHHLEPAFIQARDSYAFVILERKDAYHKEVRELMKDMKAQADLYAAKVRDLVSSLTRDALGMLFFIAFSFIARFDRQNFHELLGSVELSLLAKVLASYLLLSFLLQLSAHWRDVHLADSECKIWLSVLQHYSSHSDKKDRFLDPISKRRQTFYGALIIAAISYFLLAFMTWNLPDLISAWIALESGE
ncbi:hypothetical protein [Halomonas korlensis]|uniref:Uncharacterized protein n=1 Tax=Halomonas korlensis TaxID=463301 RepID=A0A1I7FJN2_9GAMM|nr:hypothetical protein [Halomonas korlensis]SFU36345.1 hypothetical protein SAMN04487955_101535 [Halomonas korlensis]